MSRSSETAVGVRYATSIDLLTWSGSALLLTSTDSEASYPVIIDFDGGDFGDDNFGIHGRGDTYLFYRGGGSKMCAFMTSFGDGVFPVEVDRAPNGAIVKVRIVLATDQALRNLRAVNE